MAVRGMMNTLECLHPVGRKGLKRSQSVGRVNEDSSRALRVRVVFHRQDEDKVVRYGLCVALGKTVWEVKHRYSEFCALRATLQKFGIHVPHGPSRFSTKPFALGDVAMDHLFYMGRQAELQEFLDSVLVLQNSPAEAEETVLNFLHVPPQSRRSTLSCVPENP